MNKLNLSALLEKAHEAKQECIEKNGFYSQKAEKFMKSLDLNTITTLCEALIEAREALGRIKNCLLDDEYYKYGSDGIIMQNICVSDLAFETIAAKIEFGSEEK